MSRLKPKPRPYHHGDLPVALLMAAERLIEEQGVDAFSLREVARRAGVSAAAPAHHFGDARGLLTRLAAQGFQGLGDALAAADDRKFDRESRIRAQGIAYVKFAMAHPGRFTLMWRNALLDFDDPELGQASQRAFQTLDRAVRGDVAVGSPGDPACAPSIACWSIAHGFALLSMSGAFGVGEEVADAAQRQMLPAVLAFLSV